MKEEGGEYDSDIDQDMPPILPRVANADEIGRIIQQDYIADGLSEEFVKERLTWDRMSRPLLDGGEGKPKHATVQLNNHCHANAAEQGPEENKSPPLDVHSLECVPVKGVSIAGCCYC